MESKKEPKKEGVFIKPDFLIAPYDIVINKKTQPIDWILYGVIYWFQHLKEGKCIASNPTLAKVCNQSVISIRHSLKRLEDLGYITRIYKDKQKKVRQNIMANLSFSSGRYKSIQQVGTKVYKGGRYKSMHRDSKSIKKVILNKKEVSIAKSNFAGKDINLLIEEFKILNPTYEKFFSNKTQRGAVERLAKKFGSEVVRKAIRASAKCLNERYAPTITTPLQLEDKFANLWAYYSQNKPNKLRKA